MLFIDAIALRDIVAVSDRRLGGSTKQDPALLRFLWGEVADYPLP